MTDPPLIILTNDDGVDAPGLEALRQATDRLTNVKIMGPLGPQSGCGHVVTNHRPIAIIDRSDRVAAVDGTPADCVRMAVHRHGSKIAWVLSGVNEGGNLGADLHHSGTVAAVREAALHGIPGIAISHYVARGRPLDWEQAARWTAVILQELMAQPPGPGQFWNVNLPHPEPGGPDPEVVYCPVDPSPLPLSFRQEPSGLIYNGNYQGRPRIASHDVEVCFGGRISVSKVQVMAST